MRQISWKDFASTSGDCSSAAGPIRLEIEPSQESTRSYHNPCEKKGKNPTDPGWTYDETQKANGRTKGYKNMVRAWNRSREWLNRPEVWWSLWNKTKTKKTMHRLDVKVRGDAVEATKGKSLQRQHILFQLGSESNYILKTSQLSIR